MIFSALLGADRNNALEFYNTQIDEMPLNVACVDLAFCTDI